MSRLPYTLSAALCLACAGLASADLPDLGPPPDFIDPDIERAALGQLLFYDPILSGNQNISCGTCHHPRFGTSDGVSLSLGEGGVGLGPERSPDPENLPEQRLPRNAPALWNLGAQEFTVMFHDGRLEADEAEPNGIRTPLGSDMTTGFDSVLSAQSMFPVLSGDEMAGHYSENEISRSVRLGMLSQEGGAWDQLAARVQAIPAYSERLEEVRRADESDGFPLISNLIADFIRFEWRADNSPFDRAMRGEAALDPAAQRGMDLFYGEAGCSSCHSGWFQTDHAFHAIALPQIGPGKAARFENHARDEGRMRVTGDPEDAYAFRTPSLRNVKLTAPYGHNGAYSDLDSMIRHHLDPLAGLQRYDPGQARLPALTGAEDTRALNDPEETARIAAANDLAPVSLSDAEIADLIAFLGALTHDAKRLGVPETVPSGLPVDR
ncbi:cytochrome c peroxidase [Ruegeria sp. 2205SS24-7]|uniref:cytochrome-c peroxidase n=1 Tax=Ruegeria discodermiae TaxID=3064389 RepID=UPI00274106FE|nr:cytochrome c peroxidase [Ruegeria sp. 2205SS24-7]MDP5217709.1 cytochrome c peroxidase [Ruegeria sp. 2205SS24-7]